MPREVEINSRLCLKAGKGVPGVDRREPPVSTELGAPLRCDASHPARREVRDDQSVRRRVCLASVGVALFASIVLFFELGDHRTLGSHEVFTAVPAREMLESGDWIVPTYGGLHRLRKPPLGYWVTASSSWLIGESSELSARLPSAVSALLLVGLVGWWWRVFHEVLEQPFVISFHMLPHRLPSICVFEGGRHIAGFEPRLPIAKQRANFKAVVLNVAEYSHRVHG